MLLSRTGFSFLALAAMAVTPLSQAHSAPERERAAQATAVFAMGCFWCGEADFEKVPGVTKVVSGYTGGRTRNPTYEDVSADGTGHYEAVLVTYDPQKIKYSDLLTIFWKNVDPFDAVGQFCDKGSSYRAAIFPGNAAERKAAQASRDYLVGFFKRDLATSIAARTTFYPAEEYHQDYYKKNPIRYRYYRSRCGRDDRLAEVWGK
jgi:peptide-methionine (S)-S-oxide reductase